MNEPKSHFPRPRVETFWRDEKCPTCGSHQPHLHPAVQSEGEVSICPDPFHGLDAEGHCPLHHPGYTETCSICLGRTLRLFTRGATSYPGML